MPLCHLAKGWVENLLISNDRWANGALTVGGVAKPSRSTWASMGERVVVRPGATHR